MPERSQAPPSRAPMPAPQGASEAPSLVSSPYGNAADAEAFNRRERAASMGECAGAEVVGDPRSPSVLVNGQPVEPRLQGEGDVGTEVAVLVTWLKAYFRSVGRGAGTFINRSAAEVTEPGSAVAEALWEEILDGVTDAASGAVAAPFAATIPVGAGVVKGLAKTAFAAAAAGTKAGAQKPSYKDPEVVARQEVGEALQDAVILGEALMETNVRRFTEPVLKSRPDGLGLAKALAEGVKRAVEPAGPAVAARTHLHLEGRWHDAKAKSARDDAWVPGLVEGGPAEVEAFWAPGLNPVVQASRVPGADARLLDALTKAPWVAAGIDLEVRFANLGALARVRGGRVVELHGSPEAERTFAAEAGPDPGASVREQALRGANLVVGRLQGRGLER